MNRFSSITSLTLAAFIGLSISTTVSAYENELLLGHFSFDSDSSETTVNFVGGTHYFQDIDPEGNTPLGEADFVSKSSQIFAAYGLSNANPDSRPEIDGDLIIIGGDYYFIENIAIGFGLTKRNYNSTSVTNSASTTENSLAGTYFISEATAVAASYSWGEEDFSSVEDTSAFSLKAKTLIDNKFSILAGLENSTVEASGGDEDTSETGVGFMYYATPTIGLGTMYTSTSRDEGNDSTEIEIAADVFINDNTFFEASFTQESEDNTSDDGSSFLLALNLRL